MFISYKCTLVADEALADESEASDDALDRAEAALRARTSSAAGNGGAAGGRGRIAAAAAAAAGGGPRRSRRPSSKDTRKAEAAALVQNLQRRGRAHGRSSRPSRGAEAGSS
eukprot:COSAG03_NODE_4022_length_1718_cov_1.779494_1_plen_110_part_10